MTPLPNDDIPEALRDSTTTRSPSLSSQGKFPVLWIAILGAGAIALGAVTALLWQPIVGVANQTSELNTSEAPDPSLQANNQAASNSDNTNNTVEDDSDGVLLGHKPYQEAAEDLLIPVVGDGSIRLRAAAAESFAEMVASARANGVRLQPLSGFRTEEEQSYLFFQVKEARKQGSVERATVSAPPGYSEHHTGYAIDIGDATQPSANVNESFAETAAFEWLENNASAYSFELSFEGGTDAEVSYEPWHWRFVGDRHSLETFYGNNPTTPLRESGPTPTLGQTTVDLSSEEPSTQEERGQTNQPNAVERF